MNYLKARGNAMTFALQGLLSAFRKEAHLRLHLVVAVIVTIAGFYFGISLTDWCIVLTCIFMVMVIELINSAFERLCDLAMPDIHPTVKYIKDISAGAVLLTCIFSALVGIIVFYPYLAAQMRSI
jgi:diacylglycerol kinase